jgi:integrase
MADKPRRSAGDGTLFRRGDGYWVGGVELAPGFDGKRRFKRIVRKSRNDCVVALRNLKKDVDAGRVTGATSTSVAKWLAYWQSDILPHRNIKPGTALSYAGIIRNHIAPHLGAKRLDKLHPADIRNLYTTLQDTVGGRSAQKADQVLRLALAAAVRDGILGVSVMDRVDKPAHTTKDATVFSAATSMHIIATALATQGDMWGTRWALGFTTGARESEILGLEWDRVDLEAATVDISWQLQRQQKSHGCGRPVDGAYPCGRTRSSFCPGADWKFPPGMVWRDCEATLVFTKPKTKAGNRIVPLVPAMVDALRALRTDQGPNPHGLVFHHPDGTPITQDQDQKQWKRLLADAGVPHAPQHSIRHSTATLLMEANVDSHVVQTVIGHSNVAVTRGYQHVDLELARRAWANLGTLMPAVGHPD